MLFIGNDPYLSLSDTEEKKDILFSKFRKGEVRILMGSTAKLGTGTNVQDLLVAEHDLDIPWRPSDVEQRCGRIRRQGNSNDIVKIFRYIVEGSFDAYSWQIIENKQKFISQIMTNKTVARSMEDIDETVLSYAEIKALATGNPLIKQKMETDLELSRLQTLYSKYNQSHYNIESDIAINYPKKLSILNSKLDNSIKDINIYSENHKISFNMVLRSIEFTDKTQARATLLELSNKVGHKDGKDYKIGNYQGFDLILRSKCMGFNELIIRGNMDYRVELNSSYTGTINKIDEQLNNIESNIFEIKNQISDIEKAIEDSKIELKKTFPQKEELERLIKRQSQLDSILDLGKSNETNGMEEIEEEISKEKKFIEEQEEEVEL